jgi:transcription antitermination protein NusB
LTQLDEGPRHEARERALALLYEAELKDLSPTEVLASLPVAPDPFARDIVVGVESSTARIDEFVASAAVAWELHRMPVVDRTILRMATYELAKQYSTDDSGRFVNGVLSEVARKARTSPEGGV